MAAVAKLHEKPSQPRRYPSKIDMTKVSGKVTISIDVTELGPIQLEVGRVVDREDTGAFREGKKRSLARSFSHSSSLLQQVCPSTNPCYV